MSSLIEAIEESVGMSMAFATGRGGFVSGSARRMYFEKFFFFLFSRSKVTKRNRVLVFLGLSYLYYAVAHSGSETNLIRHTGFIHGLINA